MSPELRLGNAILHFEEPKRGGIRWALGSSNGLRSSTWRLWGNKKGDFYIAARTLGGILKTSLHRDGRCHTGFTEPFWERVKASLADRQPTRHSDRWTLPTDRLVRAVQIAVPGDELRPFPAADEESMRWLDAPHSDEIGVVSVFTAPAGDQPDSWPGSAFGSQPIGIIATGTRTAWAVYQRAPYDLPTRDFVQEQRAKLELRSNLPRAIGLRGIVWGHRKPDDNFFIEIAWQDP